MNQTTNQQTPMTAERAAAVQRSGFMRALRGEAVTPAPVWVMRQAGRYLPEYRETRARAGSFLDLCFTPELAAEVTLQPIRRFGFDAAILFSDILVIPWALGQPVDFVEGVGPVLEPITTEAAFERLEFDGFLDRLAPVFQAIGRITAALPPHVPLIGFAGAPWTLATYMIAGRGTPDQGPAKALAASNSALFQRMIALLERCCAALLARQIAAGADAVKLFDSWAGSAPAPERMVVEPLARIAEALRSDHPETPLIVFPRQFGARLPQLSRIVAPNALALDQDVDIDWLRSEISDEIALQGALDPTLLLGEREPLQAALDEQRQEFRGAAHIFNLGHGVTPEAKIENVEFMLDYWRNAS